MKTPPKPVPLEAPVSDGISLFDLKRRDCHAIVVDSTRLTLALYCGAPAADTGPPYCPFHLHEYYRPPKR